MLLRSARAFWTDKLDLLHLICLFSGRFVLQRHKLPQQSKCRKEPRYKYRTGTAVGVTVPRYCDPLPDGNTRTKVRPRTILGEFRTL